MDELDEASIGTNALLRCAERVDPWMWGGMRRKPSPSIQQISVCRVTRKWGRVN